MISRFNGFVSPLRERKPLEAAACDECAGTGLKPGVKEKIVENGNDVTRLSDAVFVNIFRGHAERRTDRDGGDRDPGFAGDDVPGRPRRSAKRPGSHFRQDA